MSWKLIFFCLFFLEITVASDSQSRYLQQDDISVATKETFRYTVCKKKCSKGQKLVAPCKCVPRGPSKWKCKRLCPRGQKLVAPCKCVRRGPSKWKCKRLCPRGQVLVAPCRCVRRPRPKPLCRKLCPGGQRLVFPCKCVGRPWPASPEGRDSSLRPTRAGPR